MNFSAIIRPTFGKIVTLYIVGSIVFIGLIARAYVFLPDDRKPLTTEEKIKYQNRVGMIWGNNVAATGFLFLRQDIVLTAAHAFYDKQGQLKGPIDQYHFYVGENLEYTNTHKKIALKRLVVGTTSPGTYDASDWAVVQLEHPAIGEPFKRFMTPEDMFRGMKLIMFGFPGDLVPFVMYSAPGIFKGLWRERENDIGPYLETNCDAAKGSSGSPALVSGNDDDIVVGIMVSTSKDYVNGKWVNSGPDKPHLSTKGIYITEPILKAVENLQ